MVQPITTNARVKAMGDFMLRSSDTFIIAGCPFNLSFRIRACRFNGCSLRQKSR